MHAQLLQSCLTLCTPTGYSLPGFSLHGDSPGKNTGMGCHCLLQVIFLTQGSNPRLLWLLHWQMGSLPLSYLGSPPPSYFQLLWWLIFKRRGLQSWQEAPHRGSGFTRVIMGGLDTVGESSNISSTCRAFFTHMHVLCMTSILITSVCPHPALHCAHIPGTKPFWAASI